MASVPYRSLRRSSPLLGGLIFLVACGATRAPAPSANSSGSATTEGPRAAVGGPVLDGPIEHEMAQAPMEAKRKSLVLSERDQAAPVVVASGTPAATPPEGNTESYDHLEENGFTSVKSAPLSTFSIDVDTASYSNVRRFLAQETRPPAGAVRIEELVNYFDYDYPAPRGDEPFAVYTEVGPAPWRTEHQLLHIGLQGKRIATADLPARNLVFLIDVSGSMDDPNKLPLLKRSFAALLSTLGERDSVSMVVYAGASGLVLPPTAGNRQAEILGALDRLSAGGSTNGGQGIELAYAAAQESFKKGGVNRVILATDGDFNIGTTSESELVRLIEKKRESGVFLTVLGFGMGNYKDSNLEKLADHGNGNYAYIDSYAEARKVLVEEGGANLVTIAQDVKIQVEMNPAYVGAYRLIGYENRRLTTEDFTNDKKDAGDIGAGHTVTALYELLTPEQAARELKADDLRYQTPRAAQGKSTELCTVNLRFKKPLGATSQLAVFPVQSRATSLNGTSESFRFSAAVAGFGMLLRDSEFKGTASYALVGELAQNSLGRDAGGYRHEFLSLVGKARGVAR